ncbi:MAG: HAMP domain-containing sensor histidine kinase [Lactobacillaceae bacterium]|jgi:signal transduction histidine kinase|nr:HAMP domain-containing sensor histidine kinase [Lactobacillaceae bacterium]
MKLIYRQMLSFFAVICTLLIIVTISFINVTNRTLYTNTWRELQQDADSLIQDSIKYDQTTRQFKGLKTSSLKSNANLLARQNVHFAIYDADQQKIFASNGYTATLTKKEWQALKQGKTIQKKIDHPRLDVSDKNRTKEKSKPGPHPSMTDILRPYFYQGKLVAVVSIGTFVSTVEQSRHQILNNLLATFVIAMLVALVVSYLLARSTTQRISKMRRATHQIARGNYKVHIDTQSNDELDDLGRDFNQMADALQASQEEIRQQEERRRRFMADAAHEMRTPLTTINGLLEGLAYDAIPEEDKKHSIQLMQNDTRRLIRLVNDTLDYEKIRTNQISMDRKVFDATAVINNLQAQLRKKAKVQNDELAVDLPKVLRVYADYDRFVQIMFNIVQNAIQFTKNGKIEISGRRLPKGAEFAIQDNGIGMTKEQTEQIWERFYKADRSRMNTQYGESGLGLAIVHHLVELHGGTIKVASELGKGTTFTLFFPDREYAPHAITPRSETDV